jgi:hypothetical protein
MMTRLGRARPVRSYVKIKNLTIINSNMSASSSDSGSGSDNFSLVANISSSDSGSSVENNSINQSFSSSDSGIFLDVPILIISNNDNFSGADNTELLEIVDGDNYGGSEVSFEIILASDIAIAIENYFISVLVVSTDSSTAIENNNVSIPLQGSDSGSFLDSSSPIIVHISNNDSGIGSEIYSIISHLMGIDIGQGNESYLLLAIPVQSENGTILENVGLTILNEDTAIGLEQIGKINFTSSDSGSLLELSPLLRSSFSSQENMIASDGSLVVSHFNLNDFFQSIDASTIYSIIAATDVMSSIDNGFQVPRMDVGSSLEKTSISVMSHDVCQGQEGSLINASLDSLIVADVFSESSSSSSSL